MPKLLHLADIHIGIENYGRLNPATGLHTRLEDYLQRLDEVLDYALEREPVDLVLIAGDIYKNRAPNPTHQREFARRIRRLSRAGVPVFLLLGNHDAPAAQTRAHSVEIFDTLEVEGVTIAARLRSYTLATRNGPLQIIAVPWLNRQALLSKEELIGLPLAALETEVVQRVARFVEQALAQLDPRLPTVVAFHGTLQGATLGAERNVMLGHDLALPRSVLALPGVDYIALGHIHRHQAIGDVPPAVYPGSIERIDFGEEHETKGFVIAEVEKGRAAWRFVEVHARPFVTVRVDVRDHPDAQERIRRAIARHDLQGAIARVIVVCRPEQRSIIDERVVRLQVQEAGAAHVAAIVLDVERTARGRFAEVAHELRDGLTPLRALELYLRSRHLPAARRERLMQAAEGLLREG